MRLDFANPALLWGLLAALLPLAIHLFFRRRPRPLPFPALDFVLRARRETERRLRLRRILLFAARTALVAAAALALSRPRAVAPEAAAVRAGPSAVALVLDASASMRYQLGGRTLFERARADALEVLSGLGNDEPATALVCGGPAPPSAAPPGFDRAAVRRVLREAEPGFGHSDLTACLAAAARALSESSAGAAPGRRIAVATDLCASAWRLEAPPPMVRTPAGPARPSVTLLDAARGAALPNAAVTALAAEPDPGVGPRGWRFTATLAGFGGGEPARDVPLALRVGLGKEARAPLRAFAEIPAGGTARKVLSHAFAAGGPTAVGVALPPDALPVDDEAWLTLTVPREVRALVVDGSPSPVRHRDEAFFVEAALASSASPIRPSVVDAEGLPRVRFADFDVVFLLNVRSLGGKAAELGAFVEKGGGLFLALGEEVDP
ncbi:MAG TPA: VWA domain-containing protein, partial [Anaeromyxobacteraceae bacterium]|nr:VWA domain-containing protein [Anaeromyxobacteraceae bacterium]